MGGMAPQAATRGSGPGVIRRTHRRRRRVRRPDHHHRRPGHGLGSGVSRLGLRAPDRHGKGPPKGPLTGTPAWCGRGDLNPHALTGTSTSSFTRPSIWPYPVVPRRLDLAAEQGLHPPGVRDLPSRIPTGLLAPVLVTNRVSAERTL